MTPIDRPSPPILGAAVTHPFWGGWLIKINRGRFDRDPERCRVCGRKKDAHPKAAA